MEKTNNGLLIEIRNDQIHQGKSIASMEEHLRAINGFIKETKTFMSKSSDKIQELEKYVSSDKVITKILGAIGVSAISILITLLFTNII